MNGRIAVLGAGMVGTCAALELASRGHEVVLIDRKAPGEEASFGNAGVIARESVIPLNNPDLWKALPGMLLNRGAKLRWSPGYALRNAGWMLRFLGNARGSRVRETAMALNALLGLSQAVHGQWLRDAGIEHRLREEGWLDLHQTAPSLAGAEAEIALCEGFGMRMERLTAGELHDLEPHVAPGFAGAVWSRDAASVDNPGAVVKAYAALLMARGGEVRRAEVRGLTRREAGWEVALDGEVLPAGRVVVAMGAWSREVLAGIGIRAHLANERGYHMHYSAHGNAVLGRPYYDVSGGYVLAPMEMGLRLTTGVELAATDAPENHAQLRLAEAAARRAFPLAGRRDAAPWLGRRPTTPDSRPVIGAAPGRPGLWLDYGHQHIGFTTGPGSAKLLTDLMEGRVPCIDAEPFDPARFGRVRRQQQGEEK